MSLKALCKCSLRHTLFPLKNDWCIQEVHLKMKIHILGEQTSVVIFIPTLSFKNWFMIMDDSGWIGHREGHFFVGVSERQGKNCKSGARASPKRGSQQPISMKAMGWGYRRRGRRGQSGRTFLISPFGPGLSFCRFLSYLTWSFLVTGFTSCWYQSYCGDLATYRFMVIRS